MRRRARSNLPLRVLAFIIGAVLVITVVAVVLASVVAVEGLIIWALWNALVPSLVSGPSVTYAQGVLISVALNLVGAIIDCSTLRVKVQ